MTANVLSVVKTKLKSGVVYSGDNGRMICVECAGQSALYTGRDISGKRVVALTAADAAEWVKLLGKPLACERGCTTMEVAK